MTTVPLLALLGLQTAISNQTKFEKEVEKLDIGCYRALCYTKVDVTVDEKEGSLKVLAIKRDAKALQKELGVSKRFWKKKTDAEIKPPTKPA